METSQKSNIKFTSDGLKKNILSFLCEPPESVPEEMLEFWNQQGSIVTICKNQGNPIKNMIFNKKEGIDLMKTHSFYNSITINE